MLDTISQSSVRQRNILELAARSSRQWKMVCSTALSQTLTRPFQCNKLLYLMGVWHFKRSPFAFLHQNEKFLVHCYAFLVGILRSNKIAEIMTSLLASN